MMRRLLTATLALLLSMPPAFVMADDASSTPPVEGDRIRLDASGVGDQPIIGRLLSADQSALAVTRDDGGVVNVPRSAIRELEVARGRRSHAKKGAIIGAAAGAGLILAAYAVSEDDCDSDACGVYAVAYSTAFAAFGGLVGAGIGKMFKTDRWVQVDPGRVKVSLAPRGRGVALRVSVAF
jgi:hypothetical protein